MDDLSVDPSLKRSLDALGKAERARLRTKPGLNMTPNPAKIFVAAASAAILLTSSNLMAQERLSENDIDWCKENLTYYSALGRHAFLENQHWSMRARVCAHLYDDPLWQSSSPDRAAQLIERSAYYIDYEIEMSENRAKTGVWNPGTKPVSERETLEDQLRRQGQRIVELEKIIEQKDQLISEQVKTIQRLYSQGN